MNPLKLPESVNYIPVSACFNMKEFECPCCGRVMLDWRILEFLIAARQRFGNAIIITSGYRCKLQNLRVNGHPLSKHLIGMAADIAPTSDKLLEELFQICNHLDSRILVVVHDQKRYIHIEVK